MVFQSKCSPKKLIGSRFISSGKCFGAVPTNLLIIFCKNNDTPIAVINNAILGDFLKGLYAIFSIKIPSSAEATIATNNVGSNGNFSTLDA